MIEQRPVWYFAGKVNDCRLDTCVTQSHDVMFCWTCVIIYDTNAWHTPIAVYTVPPDDEQ
jgi:hypothetical protein